MKNTLIALFFIAFNANSQSIKNFKVISFNKMSVNNKLKEQRLSSLNFKSDTILNISEANLSIRNIKYVFKAKHTMIEDADTTSFEEEEGVLNTDFPIPKSESEKNILESYVNFVKTPVKTITNKDGFFSIPKIKQHEHIINYSVDKLPYLNKNAFLSPFLLNFDASKENIIDTVFANHLEGRFITSYKKVKNGYDIEGHFEQFKMVLKKENENNTEMPYDYWRYKGLLICNQNLIKEIRIKNETQYTMMIRVIKYEEKVVDNYEVLIENEYNN